MKKIIIIIFLFLYGCASSSFTNGGIVNSGTIVQDGNFKYIGKVRGEAQSERLFIVYRLDTGDIYNRAMADIYNKADLYSSPKRGLINIVYDYRFESRFIFNLYGVEICTITADVIEYTD